MVLGTTRTTREGPGCVSCLTSSLEVLGSAGSFVCLCGFSFFR